MNTTTDLEGQRDHEVAMEVLQRLKNKNKLKKEKLESVDDGKLRNRNKKDRSKEEPLEVDGKPGKKKLRSYKSDNVDTGEPNTRNKKARSNGTEGCKSNREQEMKKLEAFWERVGLLNIGHLKGDPPPDEHSKLKGTDKTKCDKKIRATKKTNTLYSRRN